jgi:hypothetical protein
MAFWPVLFVSTSCFMNFQSVASHSLQLGLEISSEAEFIAGRSTMMRRDQQSRDALVIEGQNAQLPRTTSTTTLVPVLSQAKPNDKLCVCDGCLLNGVCQNKFSDLVLPYWTCRARKGTWCEDKGSALWVAPTRYHIYRYFGLVRQDYVCLESQRSVFNNLTLNMFVVRLFKRPGKGYGHVTYDMIDMETGNSSLALLPCVEDSPDQIRYRKNKIVLVQGYFADHQRIAQIYNSAHQDVAETLFKDQKTLFVILNVQDNETVVPDVRKRLAYQVDAEHLAGALRDHWSPQMSIAVALVTCPRTSLAAKREKVKQAFFSDFANAIARTSHGQIKVTGDVIDVVIACPAKPQNADLKGYFKAVNAMLTSNSVWIDSKYKAIVVPKGWMKRYGLAYSPGNLSFYRDLGAEDASNIMHEIGHNLGLDHAAILPSNNPSGYDENGDCSSAMSRCGKIFFYTLASNWFLGFNTFQKEFRLDDAFASPVSVRITSHTQNKSSGVLLTRSKDGEDVPAFTVSFLRKADVPNDKQDDLEPWLEKVHVHKLPAKAYDPVTSVAILGLKLHSTYVIPGFPVKVSFTSQDGNSATVDFTKT